MLPLSPCISWYDLLGGVESNLSRCVRQIDSPHLLFLFILVGEIYKLTHEFSVDDFDDGFQKPSVMASSRMARTLVKLEETA